MSQVCNISFLVVCVISPDIVDGLQLGLLLALQVRFEGLRVLLTWRMMSLVDFRVLNLAELFYAALWS